MKRRAWAVECIRCISHEDSTRIEVCSGESIKYTARIQQLMNKAFRASSRMRPKWDEYPGSQTYGEIAIGKV
ncbi:hypothetical protein ACFQFH_15135 [Halobaculum halobium]|uniref:NrS-1 polymerase-like HBD domain-containing protein n=1 Tax=Halobaculum halobium TaxID=3032281 RepID=A0ABD5THN0_9EURY